MKREKSASILAASSLAAILFAVPDFACAYIGPGAGISAIGTVVALIFAVILTLIGFIWYPVKRLIMRRRNAPKPR